MRRTHLRGHKNILKRLLVYTGGFNLGLAMRKLIGYGKPRQLQGLFALISELLAAVWMAMCAMVRRQMEKVGSLGSPFGLPIMAVAADVELEVTKQG